MTNKFIILFLFLNCFLMSNASPVTVTVNYIDHEGLLKHNFHPTAYAKYQQAFQDSVTIFFQNSKVAQNVKIIQSLDPNLFPFYSFSAKPALHDTVRHALQKKLMSISPIASLYLPFSSEIIFTINGGCKDRGLDYTPQLTDPKKMRHSRYEYGDLEQDFNFLKDWIAKGGLPILSNMLNTKLQQYGIELIMDEKNGALFVENELYFQMLQQMPKEYMTLIVLRAFNYAVSGRIQIAQLKLQMAYQFEPSNSLLRYIMDEFTWRVNYYLDKEKQFIQSIIKKEVERNNEDIELIDSLYNINPQSIALYSHLISPEIPHWMENNEYNTIKGNFFFTIQTLCGQFL